MLTEHGLEMSHGVRVPISLDWNDTENAMLKLLPDSGRDGVTAKMFQSIVGSLLWISR